MIAKKILLPAAAAGIGAAIARSLRGRQQPATYTFRGKSVLVTGGSRGLGLVMARLLADEGARLTIAARDQDELDKACDDLAARGAEVLALRCDVGDRLQVEGLIRRTAERYGGIDVLVNNAGIIQVGPLEHMKLEDFENAMSVHFWGPLYAMRAALPYMRERGQGKIVNIASIGGKIAVPHLAPYSASKFALVGLSDAMRAELAKDNITVTTVSPGLMSTGSPVNALFKGQHQREFAWFALLDNLPLVAIDAPAAARQIIEACRHGKQELTITIQARAAVLAETLFPELVARITQIVARLLPAPCGDEGDKTLKGWESGSSFTESALLEPMYRRAAENNETAARKP